ncbi:MAG: hypothetical protein KDB27_32850 [Planctomycetales bacterium]|nr:hypothetical protein [Planctomycetales bacterium]
MPDGMSPKPDPSRPQGAGHYRADDDIELPPLDDSNSNAADSEQWASGAPPSHKSGGLGLILGAAALIGAIVVGGWFYMGGGSAEKQHENWQHVAAAARVSNDSAQQLVRLDSSGVSAATSSLELSAADVNRAAMQQIRMALLRNDLVSASAALQAAQSLPSPSVNPDVVLPTIDADAATAIKQGRKELYQIELFDCCHEDGDIVEVLVNGQAFAVVPIMHQGTMLSIPLDRGNNIIIVRGVKDGGGGVTLSFRTSRGEFFARYMSVGEEHHMDVVVQ